MDKSVEAFDHFQNAMELYRQGALLQAYEEMLRAISLDPEVSDYYYWTAVILASQRREVDAVEYFKKAIEKNPKNAEYHYNYALLLFQLNQIEESVREFRKAIALNPREGKYHWALSLVYFQQRKYREGLEELNKAIELDPKNSLYKNTKNNVKKEIKGRILSYLSAGKYAEALAELEEEKKIDHNDSTLYYYSALILLKLNKGEEALAEIEKAIRIEERSEYHQLSSLILDSLGKQEEAIKEIKRAIELNPYEEINFYTYAHLLFKKGMIKDAMEMFGKFIEMSTQERLLEESIKKMELGILFAKNPEFYYYLGLGYFKLGDFQKASQYFKEAYEKTQDDTYLYWLKRAEEKIKIK